MTKFARLSKLRQMLVFAPPKIKTSPVENPLANTPVTGNAELNSLAELSDIQKAFRARHKASREIMVLEHDSEFWFAVCFHSRAEKETFLRASGLDILGDKYLSGPRAAEILKLNLEVES